MQFNWHVLFYSWTKPVTQNFRRFIERLLRALQRVPVSQMRPSEPGLRTIGLHELDRQSQPSWWECHSQELQDQPFTFCIRFGMFSTSFSVHSIGFLLRAKNTEVDYYVSLQTQGSVCGKSAAIHCSRWWS